MYSIIWRLAGKKLLIIIIIVIIKTYTFLMFINCNQITCANMILKFTLNPLAVCTVHALFIGVGNSR